MNLLQIKKSMEEFASEVEACGLKFATSNTGNWLVYDQSGKNQLLWWNPVTRVAFVKGRNYGKHQDPLELIDACL